MGLLFAKAANAYPNRAPDLKQDPGVFEVWVERLAPIDAGRALRNLNIHIDNERFRFPVPADLIRNDLQSTNERYLQLEAAHQFALRDEWLRSTKEPPEGYWQDIMRLIAKGGDGA
ncbi:hypothetical protein SAMN04487969_102459 [Paenibacillus algorifonticola]|uniref:Nucleotidyl transferase AbiEii toxin, Type IV TA system n=1 Tax=Paenibacillus algorifonticola TaxID=684063 RepID=A0A1I2AF26_9BACL|nr:hypothetical protein SAMN04487969_102459 [Paenibacillus algorifonticola]